MGRLYLAGLTPAFYLRVTIFRFHQDLTNNRIFVLIWVLNFSWTPWTAIASSSSSPSLSFLSTVSLWTPPSITCSGKKVRRTYPMSWNASAPSRRRRSRRSLIAPLAIKMIVTAWLGMDAPTPAHHHHHQDVFELHIPFLGYCWLAAGGRKCLSSGIPSFPVLHLDKFDGRRLT